MALYNNKNTDSALKAVEFSPATAGNLSFFYVKPRESADQIKQWLQQNGQDVITETTVKGDHVIVTEGTKSQGEIMNSLRERGEEMELHIPEKKVNLWKWRGILSMIGHPMQLGSGFLQKGFDKATIGFATLNLAANLTNIFFGAQKNPDEHRLQFVKGRINSDLQGELPQGMLPPEITDNRMIEREGPGKPKDVGQLFNDFMQKYSVTFGEIGLRYVGGICLVAPPNKWKAGFQALGQKGLGEAWKTWRNPDIFTRIAGSFWLAGKTIAFTAKTPDPYNDKQETAIDNFRENYAFKISTATEAAGAMTLAMDRLFQRRVVYPNKPYIPKFLHGKKTPDLLGGVGGLLFALAFVMRFNAPYGVKVVDMNEINAHLTDTLAKCPPERIPQLMADNSAYLVEHFKDKDLQFGEVFTDMMLDIYKHHDLSPKGTEPVIKEVAAADQAAQQNINKKGNGKKEEAFVSKLAKPSASHAERSLQANSESTQLSV